MDGDHRHVRQPERGASRSHGPGPPHAGPGRRRSRVAFHDPQGRTQIRLQAMANGTSSLSLFDRGREANHVPGGVAGRPRLVELHRHRGGPQEHSALLFRGRTGRRAWALGNRIGCPVVTEVQPDGLGGVVVADQDGTAARAGWPCRQGCRAHSPAPRGLGKAPLPTRSFRGPSRPSRPLGGRSWVD